MKILFCTNAFDQISNGPAKFAHLVLRINAIYPEHKIQILTEDIDESTEFVLKQKLFIPKLFAFSGMFIRMFQYFTSINRLHQVNQYDIIVFNNAIIGLWCSLKMNSVVGMVNDDNQAVASYRNYFRTLKFNKNLIFYFVEKFTCRIMPCIIVNSIYLKKLVEKKYQLNNNKVQVLYKCIDFQETMEFKEIQKNNSTILFVKNDYERGGLFQLIEALKILDQVFFLKVIGPAESSKNIIFQKVIHSKIQLKFLGIQPQNIVLAEMKNADLFCVPSIREALGIANLEAMSVGCPVVSTSAGGILEVMDNGNCGWLAQINDPIDLALQIKNCFVMDELRETKRRYAFEFIKKFSVESALNEFIKILEKVANKKKQ